VVSTIVPSKEAEITFLANPSLMLIATSIGVIPAANSLTDPSGKLILIIVFNFVTANIAHYKNTYNI
jgi:NADH:ubiquinone oxidoreductase subunit K